MRALPQNYREASGFRESDWRDWRWQAQHAVTSLRALDEALSKLGLDIGGERFLLVSGSMDIRDGYLPIYSRQNSLESVMYKDDFWSPRQQNDWNGLLKWTWHITPTHKLNLNFNRVHFEWRRSGNGYAVAMDARSDRYRPEGRVARISPIFRSATRQARVELE